MAGIPLSNPDSGYLIKLFKNCEGQYFFLRAEDSNRDTVFCNMLVYKMFIARNKILSQKIIFS